MKVPRKTPAGRKPRRNPHARALRTGLFRARVTKDRKAYTRRLKNSKRSRTDDPEP